MEFMKKLLAKEAIAGEFRAGSDSFNINEWKFTVEHTVPKNNNPRWSAIFMLLCIFLLSNNLGFQFSVDEIPLFTKK
jgi:hypothetical protein